MRTRNDAEFHNYGGRGIRVCPQWRHSFAELLPATSCSTSVRARAASRSTASTTIGAMSRATCAGPRHGSRLINSRPRRSLPRGVYAARTGGYRVAINVAGRQRHLGTCQTLDAAIAMRTAAERRYRYERTPPARARRRMPHATASQYFAFALRRGVLIERRPLTATNKPTASSTNGGEPATFAAVQAEIAAAMAAGELSLPEKFVWFEKKLKAALTDSAVTTSELEKIARETDNAIEVARQEALAARERGLDLCADARLARAEIDDVEFFVSRLLTQRPRLEALLHTRRQADQRDAYLVRYEELKIEGAALGAELADLYPGLVGPLVDLFGRLRDFREQCHRLHVTDPGSMPHVRDPELVARRLDGFTGEMQSLLEAVHLPDFTSGRELWPKSPPLRLRQLSRNRWCRSIPEPLGVRS